MEKLTKKKSNENFKHSKILLSTEALPSDVAIELAKSWKIIILNNALNEIINNDEFKVYRKDFDNLLKMFVDQKHSRIIMVNETMPLNIEKELLKSWKIMRSDNNLIEGLKLVDLKIYKKLLKKYQNQKHIKMLSTSKILPANVAIKLTKVWKIVVLDKNLLKIIKGIDLNIYQKNFVILFGESGSGKSSLLGLMSALERPSEGTVNILGKITSGLNDSELTKLRHDKIGYIFQQYGLLDAISVLDNTLIATKNKDAKYAKMQLEKLGLGKLIHKNVSDLSGGQQQRVSIARALAKKPAIIFADEPTGAVDSKTAKTIMEIFRELNAKGITIIMVTHNRNLAKLGNRIIELVDGKIVSDNKNEPISLDQVIWN